MSGSTLKKIPATADSTAIAQAIEKADLRVLLMVLFHLTADRRWLEYRPTRDVKLVADEDAGLSPEQQDEIRSAATALISRGDRPAIADPGDALITEMMAVCLGETVPPEYAPMIREEMGFVSRAVQWQDPQRQPAVQHTVVIVGAGISGIVLAARLRELGIEHVIIERNADVGGVWLENSYPGAGVDTPSHAYSYSFVPAHPWPHFFSARDEIRQYLRKSALALGVLPNVRFETEVTAATWDEDSQTWKIAIKGPSGEETIQASILVSAIGQFGEPFVPTIAGSETFRGPLVHSARWPDDLKLDGKRVAIVGSGASAMQIVPSVAEQVESMAIYQRTPQWARPVTRYHDELGDAAQWLIQNVPFYAAWYRFTCWWRYGDGLLAQLYRDPDWSHPERSINRRNDRHREEMTDYIAAKLEGRPDLLSKSIPAYPPFAKRILLDNGWYEAIARPNVELVTDRIARISPDGVVTDDGTERPADVIILATGFAINPLAARLNIRGRDGVDLRDAFEGDNPKAYLGISVSGFPNMFMMAGPNTGLAHGGSAVFQAESQARYISGMIVKMSEEGVQSCDVTKVAQDAFVDLVDEKHQELIWTHPGVSNYYKNDRGRIFSAMPFRLVDYWRMTHEASLDPCEIVNAVQKKAAAER